MILNLITACAFLFIAFAVLALGRLLLRPATLPPGPPGMVPTFGPLNEALAGQVPHSASALDALDVQLARAGYYGRHARRNFLATRNILIVGIVLVAATFAVLEGPDNPVVGWSIGGAGVLLVALAYAVPRVLLNIKARRRVERIERGLPDALDILTMCLAGGLPLRRSLDHLAGEIAAPHPDLAGELRLVMRQAEMGSLPLAFEQFARRTRSPDVRSLSVLIGDAQRLGVDVRHAGREQADAIRRTFRFRADERASRAGAKLILPFVFCLLPAVAVLLWAPALLELRGTLERESRPGGAFSQNMAQSIEELSREFNLQGTNQGLPFYDEPAPRPRSQPRQ
jgi:tight adherence protein C